MAGQLATFPADALNEAIGISVVLDMLINITPERMNECTETCRSLVVDYKRTISQLVRCLFVAARYQFRRVPFLATLALPVRVDELAFRRMEGGAARLLRAAVEHSRAALLLPA
jgi:hypothetical protein